MLGITDQEHASHGSERGASEARQGVDGGCSALRIAFKDEALIRAGRKSALDFVDDLAECKSGVQGIQRLGGPTSWVPEAEF